MYLSIYFPLELFLICSFSFFRSLSLIVLSLSLSIICSFYLSTRLSTHIFNHSSIYVYLSMYIYLPIYRISGHIMLDMQPRLISFLLILFQYSMDVFNDSQPPTSSLILIFICFGLRLFDILRGMQVCCKSLTPYALTSQNYKKELAVIACISWVTVR